MNMKTYIRTLSSVLLISVLASCNGFFEPNLENRLEEQDNYSDMANVYASFMGLYAVVQDVAPKVVVLSELMGDLMTPTDQAPDDYWGVFRYENMSASSVADPAPLYQLVVNCNDFLRNTSEYNRKYPGVIKDNIYKQMIAGAVCIRTWAYLNIGKLYGEAVYYDYALIGETDLSKQPLLSFEQLVPELIHFMNKGVDNVSGLRNVDINNMFGTSGIWSVVPVSPDALMLELYLWNKDYESAAKRGINLITGQSLMAAGDNHKNTLSYQFGSNKNGLKKWSTLFSETPVAVHGKEALTIVLFDYTQRQVNPLYSLCSTDPACEYYIRPTNVLMNKYSGKDYQDGVNHVNDPRGTGVTIANEQGKRVLCKYIQDRDIQQQDAPIYLYRAAEIHLMIAEALNALGRYDAADAVLNEGFQPYWEAGNRFYQPFDAPIYAFEKMKAGRGVRGRLDIPFVKSVDERFVSGLEPDTEAYNMKRKAVIDSLIVEETAREFAGEGKRWFAMMRIARNSGRPELLAGMISSKFQSADRQRYYEMMMDSDNWFIDYDLKLDE